MLLVTIFVNEKLLRYERLKKEEISKALFSTFEEQAFYQATSPFIQWISVDSQYPKPRLLQVVALITQEEKRRSGHNDAFPQIVKNALGRGLSKCFRLELLGSDAVKVMVSEGG